MNTENDSLLGLLLAGVIIGLVIGGGLGLFIVLMVRAGS